MAAYRASRGYIFVVWATELTPQKVAPAAHRAMAGFYFKNIYLKCDN